MAKKKNQPFHIANKLKQSVFELEFENSVKNILDSYLNVTMKLKQEGFT